MLIFIDQPKNIKVLRATADSSGAVKRERIGIIAKNKFELSDELKTALQKDEVPEVDGVISVYQTASLARKKAAALSFPETLREVVEYMQEEATEAERTLVMSALLEGLRVMRKMARGDVPEA